jgi:hypothetical protein
MLTVLVACSSKRNEGDRANAPQEQGAPADHPDVDGSARRLNDAADSSNGPIWSDSSTAIAVSTDYFFDDLGSGPGTSGTNCSLWSRSALSQSQLAMLAKLRLTQLQDACTLDGYTSVTVFVDDANGSGARYHEQSGTSCSSNVPPPPSLMLPSGSVSVLLANTDSGPCQ